MFIHRNMENYPQIMCYPFLSGALSSREILDTVKILKVGKPQTITIIVLKTEKV